MADYDANKKISQLDVLTTLASDDMIVVGDTSDSGKAKAISKANLGTSVDTTKVRATITDTTPDYLDSKIELVSSDLTVGITKTIDNSGANEKISYDLSATGGGGGGAGTVTTYLADSPCTPTDIAALSMSSNTTMTVGVISIPYQITVNSVTIGVQSVNVNGVLAFALYSFNGSTRYISDVTPTISAAGGVTVSVTPVVLSAGLYYMAFHTNGSANLNIQHMLINVDFDDFNSTGSGNVINGTLTITASTTPATINPTAITPGSNVPMVRFN